MIKDTLLAMLAPFGPSGAEGPIVDTIIDMIRPFVDDIKRDALGNVIATKRAKAPAADKKRIMFSSHMDSIGYIVLDADKQGFLRVSNVGGINPQTAGMRHITFANGVEGIICQEPLGNDKPALTKLYIDIGAADRDAALARVPVGTMAVVRFQTTALSDDLISAPYMDDRAACAVQIELLRALESPKHDVVAVFSAQEEVGCRGAAVAAYSVEPDIGVAIDVTPAGDVPKCDPPLPVCVGKGPAVKVKDSNSIATPMVRDGLVAAAKQAGIAYQYEVLPYGGTDAGPIMTSRGGVPTGTLSVACRYVHSPVETVSLSDMENAVRLLVAYVQEIV